MTKVSIIVPCFNESATILQLLDAIECQTYQHDQMEVIISDGMSDDGTREKIREYSTRTPDLKLNLVDNPDRIIPAALNRAIRASSGEILVRLDAHSVPAHDYVERCLEALDRTGAANVGGLWEIRAPSPSWIGRSIAMAAAHPLGAGDARYRINGIAGEVETVPFGAFRREWIERVGGYDESLLTNEDYELNLRLRRAGGMVWFDPSIRSIYFARPNLSALAQQYWRYGLWKARMLHRYPGSLRWRQAAPPLFVLLTGILALLGLFWVPARTGLALMLSIYAIALFASGALLSLRKRDPALLLGLPLSILTMHYAWGAGFLAGAAGAMFKSAAPDPNA